MQMTGNGVKQNSEVAGFCKAIHLLPTRKVTYSMMPYATENENCRFKKKKKKALCLIKMKIASVGHVFWKN